MGLYLAVFNGDDEIDGVDVGSYGDYDVFIQCVIKHVENGVNGSVCPVLTLHHDSDGEWSVEEAKVLQEELLKIKKVLTEIPPIAHDSSWVLEVMEEDGLKPSNAYESFIDVDGEFLIDRLVELTQISISKGLPILFQ